VQGTFSAFTASEQAAARGALALWASEANITFTDLGNSNAATIEFGNYSSSTDNSEAFAFFRGNSGVGYEGDVFINTFYASTSSDYAGTYEWDDVHSTRSATPSVSSIPATTMPALPDHHIR